VPIAAWIKSAIDRWMEAARVTEGRIFRRMNRYGKITSERLSDEGVYLTLAPWRRRQVAGRSSGQDPHASLDV